MYVFFYFSAEAAQTKAQKQITSKSDKKEIVKNDIRYRTCKQYIVHNKKYHYYLHAHCTLFI